DRPAGAVVESYFLGCHVRLRNSWVGGLALDHGEDLFLAQDDVLFAVELELGAGVLAEQDLVVLLHVEGDSLAVGIALALANGDDLAARGLLLGAVGDEQTAGGLGLLGNAPDDDAVVQGTQLHGWFS